MTERKKITLPYLFQEAQEGEPISWLTCYDYPTAYLQDLTPAVTHRYRSQLARRQNHCDYQIHPSFHRFPPN